MNLGTIKFDSRSYNLDSMNTKEIEDVMQKNKTIFTAEIGTVKKLYNRDIETSQIEKEEVAKSFQSFLDNASSSVKVEAMLYRAVTDRITEEVIKQKVNNQRNSIYAQIKSINSKFNNTNSKFSEVQIEIQQVMNLYEKCLRDYAIFFDTKIEQLILRKVELDAHLVGKIISEEYLLEKEKKKKIDKENDSLLKSLSGSIKTAIQKLTKKKNENQVDVTMISKLRDKEDVEEEQIERFKSAMEVAKNEKNENLNAIEKVEHEILAIEKEIKRLNENKRNMILNAMESEMKQLVMCKERKSLISKIKIFFKARFNLVKTIKENVLEPIEEKIKIFNDNEIESIKAN